jgi:uncharacterized repeat protein (TIGR01451 family)
MIRRLVLIAGGIFLLGATAVQAQQETKLELKTTIDKEVKVKKEGKLVTQTVPADSTSPGDTLVITVAYSNTGAGVVKDATIVNPVPKGVVLKPQSPAGKDAAITCSIDGGRTFLPPPIMVRVKKADGTEINQPAPAERYTHVKWVIQKPVSPGQSGRVSFEATVQ